MLQETRNSLVTLKDGDDLLTQREDEEFVDIEIRLKHTHLEVENMISFVRLRYEQNISRRRTDGLSQYIAEILLKTTGIEKRKRLFSFIKKRKRSFQTSRKPYNNKQILC